jgi:hypothetical protein
MAFLASRLVGIRSADGLLARVSEFYGIIRASYLSPYFPLVLAFELLRYLRPWPLTGGRFMLTRNNRLRLRLLRGAAFGVTLMLPVQGWAQGERTPASAQTQSKTNETAEEVLKREERQRILGVVPNFNTVESSDRVPPLSPGQKFHLMYKSSVDPFVFVADAFVAGLGQARNTNPGFGQGAEGYFKRFGAAYLDTADGNLWGNAILPVLLKEDPRYFRLGSGTFTHRFLYSASTTVWCKRDNGKWGPNYANVLGNFISGGISNAYYPAADRGVEQTLDGALTVTAEGVIGAEFIEFWPDISRHLFKKHHSGQ